MVQLVTAVNRTFSWFLADSRNQYRDNGKSDGDDIIELDEFEDEDVYYFPVFIQYQELLICFFFFF